MALASNFSVIPALVPTNVPPRRAVKCHSFKSIQPSTWCGDDGKSESERAPVVAAKLHSFVIGYDFATSPGVVFLILVFLLIFVSENIKPSGFENTTTYSHSFCTKRVRPSHFVGIKLRVQSQEDPFLLVARKACRDFIMKWKYFHLFICHPPNDTECFSPWSWASWLREGGTRY